MGERYEETECMRYAGSMAQLADARLMALEEGNGRGDRVIAFRNGSGLAFTVSPDRGMDLVDCSFGGIPLVFRSQTGYSAGARHEASGKGWLRNWQGGLMTTAGLRNVGAANGEFGLHGRISNLAAEDVGIRRGWEGGRYRLEASGTLRECAMFGEHLELCRTISTGLGENVIRLHDRVTNRSCREDYLQILYHCNLGYPFASPELVFDVEAHEVIPRDAEAAAGLAGGGLPGAVLLPPPAGRTGRHGRDCGGKSGARNPSPDRIFGRDAAEFRAVEKLSFGRIRARTRADQRECAGQGGGHRERNGPENSAGRKRRVRPDFPFRTSFACTPVKAAHPPSASSPAKAACSGTDFEGAFPQAPGS